MPTANELRRMSVQVYALERAARALRSDLEGALIAMGETTPEPVDSPIACGLSSLLDSDQAVAAHHARPYKAFHKGVWVSYDQSDENISAVVHTDVVDRMNGDATAAPEVARVNVNPVFTGAEQPRWMTLENRVEAENFDALESLSIQLTTYFVPLGDGGRPAVPFRPTLSLVTRFVGEDRSSVDLIRKELVATTMPLAQTVRMTAEDIAKIRETKFAFVVFILLLPCSGAYNFVVEDYRIRGSFAARD